MNLLRLHLALLLDPLTNPTFARTGWNIWGLARISLL